MRTSRMYTGQFACQLSGLQLTHDNLHRLTAPAAERVLTLRS